MIYTKTGDNGTTSLVGGTRVSKDDLRLETYGTADELNSFVGLLRAQNISKEIDDILYIIQNQLFVLGGYLATDETVTELTAATKITPMMISGLEKHIDDMEETLPVIRKFILPAGDQAVSICHVCRTVARRLERRMVQLNSTINSLDTNALIYVNRLSDFFFILAKRIMFENKCEIFTWDSGKCVE